MSETKRPLWRCPRCGHQFVTAGIWHSCSNFSLEYHFAEKAPLLRKLFDEWLAFVETHGGPVTVIPQKTRITMMVRVRFANVVARQRWLECNLWLKHRVELPRFHRIETLLPYGYFHYFKLTDAGQLDDELAALVREAYAVGCQEGGEVETT
jgi:hypothetical protein